MGTITLHRIRVSTMVLDAHLQQAVLLKKLVDAIKELCKDVNFDCSEKGLQVQAMDSSHVALVSLLLRESAFAEFKCDRATSLGMNVDSLGKILKMCGPADSPKLRWQNDADIVNFQCESGEDDRIADFDLKLMQIESEHMEIPEQQYKVVAKLPSSEFLKVCRDLKEHGKRCAQTKGVRKTRREGKPDGPRGHHRNIRFAISRDFFQSGALMQHCGTGFGSRLTIVRQVRTRER